MVCRFGLKTLGVLKILCTTKAITFTLNINAEKLYEIVNNTINAHHLSLDLCPRWVGHQLY